MVASPTGKTLDAVLAWAAVRRSELRGSSDPWAVQHDIGIARHETQGGWCHMASMFEIEWQGDPEDLHYIKRQKLGDYAEAWINGILKKRPSVDTSRGDTKAGSYVQQIRWVKGLRAWAMVEDRSAFESLLPWVTHIGKLHHLDLGAVKTFSVHEDPGAVDLWSNRPLPVGSPFAGAMHVPAMGALQSPYWKRENHCVTMCPVT